MYKILVVDDDLEILTVVKLMLTMNNFTVETVSNWKNINNKIVDFQPDLIVLDVSLGTADQRNILQKFAPVRKKHSCHPFFCQPGKWNKIRSMARSGLYCETFSAFGDDKNN